MAIGYAENKVFVLEMDEDEVVFLQRAVQAYESDEPQGDEVDKEMRDMAIGYAENEKVFVLEMDEDEVNYLQRVMSAYDAAPADKEIWEALDIAISDALEDGE